MAKRSDAKTSTGVSASAICSDELTITEIAKSGWLRSRQLHADDVLDRIAGDRDDHEPGELLAHVQRVDRRRQRADEPVGGERRTDAGDRQDDRRGHESTSVGPLLLAVGAAEEQRQRADEDDQQDAGADQRQGAASGLRRAYGTRARATASPSWPPASSVSVEIIRARSELKRCTPFRRPADEERRCRARARCSRGSSRRAPPGRRSTRPLFRAKSATKSSGRLPSADWTTPAAARAEPSPELLGRARRRAGPGRRARSRRRRTSSRRRGRSERRRPPRRARS